MLTRIPTPATTTTSVAKISNSNWILPTIPSKSLEISFDGITAWATDSSLIKPGNPHRQTRPRLIGANQDGRDLSVVMRNRPVFVRAAFVRAAFVVAMVVGRVLVCRVIVLLILGGRCLLGRSGFLLLHELVRDGSPSNVTWKMIEFLPCS